MRSRSTTESSRPDRLRLAAATRGLDLARSRIRQVRHKATGNRPDRQFEIEHRLIFCFYSSLSTTSAAWSEQAWRSGDAFEMTDALPGARLIESCACTGLAGWHRGIQVNQARTGSLADGR